VSVRTGRRTDVNNYPEGVSHGICQHSIRIEDPFETGRDLAETLSKGNSVALWTAFLDEEWKKFALFSLFADEPTYYKDLSTCVVTREEGSPHSHARCARDHGGEAVRTEPFDEALSQPRLKEPTKNTSVRDWENSTMARPRTRAEYSPDIDDDNAVTEELLGSSSLSCASSKSSTPRGADRKGAFSEVYLRAGQTEPLQTVLLRRQLRL
jgi:hypothetical protein